MLNLTNYGTWASSPTHPNPHNGQWEGLAELRDGNPQTRCLWFGVAWAEHNAGVPVEVTHLRGIRANDAPERDIRRVAIWADGTLVAAVDIPEDDARFSAFDVALPATVRGTIFRYQFQSRSSSITQAAEFAPWGKLADAPAPPPPPPVTLPPGVLALFDQLEAELEYLTTGQRLLFAAQCERLKTLALQ